MSDRTQFTVALDDETMMLLMERAAEARCPPRDIIEAIIRDVLIEDAMAHEHQDKTKLH